MNELETLRAKLKAANERIGELDQQVSDLSDRQRSPYSMGLEHGRGSKASAAVAYGAAAERARIVAWLRTAFTDNWDVLPMAIREAVSCIERGDHAERAHLPSATEGE